MESALPVVAIVIITVVLVPSQIRKIDFSIPNLDRKGISDVGHPQVGHHLLHIQLE